ncbi:MAG: nucleotidyltransferase domain-containing protein [Coriobacteriia bacterium]|nr:nucleotidyltransferase domain-containing protein [Coriobacteriia bacterium]
MKQQDLIDANRDAIRAIVSKYGCSNPRVFGSVAHGSAGVQSDIDFVIDAGEDTSLFDLSGIYYELEQMLPVGIDLVTSRQVPQEAKDSVLGSAIPV